MTQLTLHGTIATSIYFCRKCREPLTGENWQPSGKLQRHYICKECYSVISKEWRNKSKDYMREYSKKWRENNPSYDKCKSKRFHKENPNYSKEYRKNNPEVKRKSQSKRKRQLGWACIIKNPFDIRTDGHHLNKWLVLYVPHISHLRNGHPHDITLLEPLLEL